MYKYLRFHKKRLLIKKKAYRFYFFQLEITIYLKINLNNFLSFMSAPFFSPPENPVISS